MDTARLVLVVDDSDDVREFFQTVLEQAGYRVDTAENGEAGFAKVKQQRPDVIILDVVMPQMDGLQLLLKLRSDLAPPVPPIILCTGFDLTHDEALRRGAVRVLPKPVDAPDLIAAVREVLDGRPLVPESIGRAHARASAARQEARDTATRLLRELEAQAPPGELFSRHAASFVGFVARYLAVDAVVAAVLREDQLRVLASSDPARIAPDLDVGETLPAVEQVLESGSSLVLPDMATHPSFFSLANRIDQMDCLMAVPLRFEERSIGVLCVLDSCACAIAGEDLAMVQQFSRRGTELLRAWVAGRLHDELPYRLGPGVAPRRTFEQMLELELRLLHLRGGSLELALVDLADPSAVYQAVANAPQPSRLLAGMLSQGRIALYGRDPGREARAKLAPAISDLRARGPTHVGIVDLTADVIRSLHAEELVRLAEQALDDALDTKNSVRRMVIEGESA